MMKKRAAEGVRHRAARTIRRGSCTLLGLAVLCGAALGQPNQQIKPPPDKVQPPRETQVAFPPADNKETPRVPRCVENAYTMPGQSWTTKLVEGGITLKAAEKKARATTPQGIFGRNLPLHSGTATLLVLDIFDPVELPMDENEDGVYEPFTLSHGDMVVAHMLALLTSQGYALRAVTDQQRKITLIRQRSTVNIIKLPIRKEQSGPYAGLYTERGVEQALRVAEPSEHTVLNMSFAMIPCDVALEYEEARDAAKPLRYSFRWFLYFHPAAWPRVTEKPQKSWLLNEYLKNRVPNQFLAVAASGNYGMNDMTWPAKDDRVIGVGALAPSGGAWQRASFSDRADVNARGEWFQIPHTPPTTPSKRFDDLVDFCREAGVCVAGDITTNPRYDTFAYRGTSFSAPSVAVHLALSGASACRVPSGTGWTKITASWPTGTGDAAALLACP